MLSATATAQTEGSAPASYTAVPYLIGQLGYAKADLSDLRDAVTAMTGANDIQSKEDSLSYSAGVGLHVNDFVSFEARYMNMGKFDIHNSSGGKADIEFTGISLGALGSYPLSRDTSVYFRADAINVHVDIEGDSEDKWQPGVGIGIDHYLNDGLKLRGEYQHVFLKDDDDLKVPLDSVSVGLLKAF